jgi:hypothetical protein
MPRTDTQLSPMPEVHVQHTVPDRSTPNSKRIATIVKCMFKPVKSGSEKMHGRDAPDHPMALGLIALEHGPLVCKVIDSLAFDDLLAVAACNARLCLDLEVRLAFIHSYDSGKTLSTAGAAQPHWRGKLDPAEVTLTTRSLLRKCRLHARRNRVDDPFESTLGCQVRQLLTSPPPCCSVVGAYWRYMRRQQPPTRLQIALFADMVKSKMCSAAFLPPAAMASQATASSGVPKVCDAPVYVFLSPVAGAEKNHVMEQQHRQRYGSLDYKVGEAPTDFDVKGNTLSIPPAIVCTSCCHPPFTEEDVERAIFTQLCMIYGSQRRQRLQRPNPLVFGGA